MDDIRFSAGARSLEIKSADTFRPPFTLLRRRRLIEMNLRLSSLLKSRDIAQVARADMKPVVSGPFESGGFFRFAGDFSSPLRSKSFPFLCKKENMERPRATFMPVFPPHFQPAESIRVHAGPRVQAEEFVPGEKRIGLRLVIQTGVGSPDVSDAIFSV